MRTTAIEDLVSTNYGESAEGLLKHGDIQRFWKIARRPSKDVVGVEAQQEHGAVFSQSLAHSDGLRV